jgi:hypothetical protein
MKIARSFFLILAAVGFLFSIIIHALALWGRAPSSESWNAVPFLGAMVVFVSAGYLGGVKPIRIGTISVSEIVKGCPTWLKRTEYFFSAYMALIGLWLVLQSPRHLSLGKNRCRICLLFGIRHDLLHQFLFDIIWETVWPEPSRQ